MAQVTRAEHLQWCKDRALAYVRAGDFRQALNSMMSDLTKHTETNNPVSGMLFIVAHSGLESRDAEACRKFIEGFN